ncbi:TIR domain-containing protein [Ulvibacterium marinum]|nr:nucleotide-binding protein [Ulvibacterium marinum]
MKEDVKPKYEIVYSDLKNHLIGDFLVSRDFKMVMSQNGVYEWWQNIYEQVKENRTYVSLGYDHNRGDNIDTLAIVLNAIEENEEIEKVFTLITVSFIESKKTDEDFSDIIEAMTVANFSKDSIGEVEKAFEKHKQLKLPEKEVITSTRLKRASNTKKNKKDIFIVHGHNEELKEKVARTIEKLKLSPVILHEQSNEGQTIIEKFEKHSNVNFAVILLTYDDFGNVKSDNNHNKRARQNVILELGYFIAKIGRENVMPLYEKGVELPSDISGVLYTLIDESENWKFRLVKELKSAGFKVDANDII